MSYIGNTNTTQVFTPAVDYFSGNGSTTAFTLSRPVASVAQVQVTIDNVAQNPSSAYTVSANTITFTSAPLSGTNNIYVYYTSPITQVIAPSQGTVTSESFGTITNFTTTGNTVLGDATTDTLTVGVTGIVKDSSGNVGIGGTATNEGGYSRVLQVTGSTEAALEVKTGSSYSYFAQNGTTLQIRNNATSGVMTFATEATERMRIDSSGNLLLGTTSVAGTSSFDIVRPANTATYIYMLKNTQLEMTMGCKASTDSNFYIGTGSSSIGTYGVYMTNTGNSWNSVSDERQKNIVESIDNGLEKVNSLRAVIGSYKHDPKNIRRPFLIAQDVQAVLPEAVNVQDEETGILGMSYTDVIPLLVASIKELSAKNDALTARIEALENR